MVTTRDAELGPVGIVILIIVMIWSSYNHLNENRLYLTCNEAVTFSEGSAAGNLYIENRTHKTVEAIIYRADTGVIIYKSAMLPRDGFVDSDKLGMDLEPGTYQCKVAFRALDSAGSINVIETKDMTITIEK